MITAPPLAPSSTADGRTVVDELPRRVGVLPGEAELVAQHLLDALDALLAAGPRADQPQRVTGRSRPTQSEGEL